MHSWVVGLCLCTLSVLKHKEIQHLYQDLARSKVQSVLPQMTRNEIILTQLEAVQALQNPWQCDGALAMSLMDKVALISAIKNRSGPGFTFFFMHFICMNNRFIYINYSKELVKVRGI